MTIDPAALDLADPARVESAALDLLPSGIGIFDNDFKLVYANRSFRELRKPLHGGVEYREVIWGTCAQLGEAAGGVRGEGLDQGPNQFDVFGTGEEESAN